MPRREDRAAANQRATNAFNLARLRAVVECQGRLIPQAAYVDRVYVDDPAEVTAEAWDRLCVEYLRSEWPPSMLN